MSALLALLKQKQQDMSASRKGRTAKITDGTTRWRVYNSWRGVGQQFWHDFGQHFVKDSTGKISAIYMCAERTFGKPCAVCDAVSQGIKSATDDQTMIILNDAKSASRVLVNASQLDGPEPHKVQILEMAPTVFESIVGIAAEWEEAGETIFGPNGKDLIITRTGTGKQTKYTVQIAAKTTTVPADIEKKLNDLDDYVAQESSEAMNRALNSVRAVSGLLPAPATSGGMSPAARGAAMLEDPYAPSAPPKKVVEEFEDVPDLTVAAPPKKAAPAAAAPVAAATSTGDDDLDSLLKELG